MNDINFNKHFQVHENTRVLNISFVKHFHVHNKFVCALFVLDDILKWIRKAYSNSKKLLSKFNINKFTQGKWKYETFIFNLNTSTRFYVHSNYSGRRFQNSDSTFQFQYLY
jgi:hypothetical protein